MSDNFTEAELNIATLAGISKEGLQVAMEYPDTGFGAELRKHFEWGAIDEMLEHRQQEGEDADPSQFWLGGSFSTALAFGPLRSAYSRADRQNIRILVDLFGVPDGVHVPDEVLADVEAGNVMVYKEASA